MCCTVGYGGICIARLTNKSTDVTAGHHSGVAGNSCSSVTNGHAPHSPYRPHTLVGEASNVGSAAGIHLGQSSRHHNMRQGGRGGASHHSAAASRNQESRSRHHHTPSSVSGSQVPIQASEGWEIRDNGDTLSHHSVPAWPARTNPR